MHRCIESHVSSTDVPDCCPMAYEEGLGSERHGIEQHTCSKRSNGSGKELKGVSAFNNAGGTAKTGWQRIGFAEVSGLRNRAYARLQREATISNTAKAKEREKKNILKNKINFLGRYLSEMKTSN